MIFIFNYLIIDLISHYDYENFTVDIYFGFTIRHGIKTKMQITDVSATHVYKITTDNMNFQPCSLFRINISFNPTRCQSFHFRVMDHVCVIQER